MRPAWNIGGDISGIEESVTTELIVGLLSTSEPYAESGAGKVAAGRGELRCRAAW